MSSKFYIRLFFSECCGSDNLKELIDVMVSSVMNKTSSTSGQSKPGVLRVTLFMWCCEAEFEFDCQLSPFS